jgi:hypothetical protein
MPQSLASRLGPDGAEAALRYEIMEEQAASLGRSGRKVEAALAALQAHAGEGREPLLTAAADAVWSLLVQREVMGMRDRDRVVAEYGVPREVLVRLGAR